MSNYYNRQWRLPNNENKDKQSNYSLDFTVLQNIEIPATSSFDFGTTNFSVSWWMKKGSPSATSSIPLINIGSYGQTNAFIMYFNSTSNKLVFYRTGQLIASSTITISNSIWNFCTLVRDGANATLYIKNSNGDYSEVLSTSLGSTNFGNSTSPSFFGGNNSSASKYWDGQLDAVSIFNYALSTSQITTLYGSSSTGIGNPMSLNPKPVAYYPLGDQDSFNGADYLVPNSSLKDYVFDFDGTDDYINIPDSSSLRVQNLTISLWINANTQSNNYRYFLEKGSLSYIIYTGATTTDLLFLIYDGSTYYYSNALTNALDNNWHHIAFTYDGSQIIGYKDGVANTPVSASGTILHDTNPLRFFSRATAPTNEPFGKMSNVQIFNTALSSTDVETLYNNGSPLTSMSGFTSLQGWWKLDASATYDSSTTTWSIPDDSSNSNTGTSSGMTQANLVQSDLSFTSGYSPYALDFDGTDDYIDCGTSQLVDFSSSFTISAWVYITSTASGYDCVYAFKGASNAFVMFFNNGSGYSPISFGSANYPTDATIKCATNVTLNKWNNIVIVYNGNGIATPSNYTFYIDNTSHTLTNSAGFSDNGNVNYIGRYDPSHSFTGSISNVSIWNAALTSTQVTEIYSEGKPSNLNNHSAYSNLVSWWQLGSNSSFNTNWTVLDEKGSNNGTSVNMTEDDIVDGVNTYGGGTSSGMGGDEVIGDAPYSSSNSLSINMDALDRVEDTPS